MKRFLIALLVALIVPVVATAYAQSATPISYGQALTGEITNEQFEVPYTFTGKQGDVVIIQMTPVDILADLDQPALILLDSSNNVLASDDSFSTTSLAVKLPADGAYTILATRADGRAGTSIGEFTLALDEPPVLEPGSVVEGSVSSDGAAFYVFETGGGFVVTYTRTSGDFTPELRVNQIASGNTLEDVASLSGSGVTGGQISIGSTGSLANTTYVIVFQEALFDFNFEPVTANFTISVKATQ